VARLFVLSLVPIAIAYHLAHYFTYLLIQGQLLIRLASDPLGLYNAYMGSDTTFGGITRTGGSGSYTYVATAGFVNKPVVYVSFWDALRFANWLHNGQGGGDTETGAYTLDGGTANPSNGITVTRNGGAITFLPSENEWYKAAYFNGTTYFNYPAGTDTQTVCALPTATANRANCNDAVGAVADVGAYTGSASPYGTFDQGGNVNEWNEQIVGSNRGLRGGAWNSAASSLDASARSSASRVTELGTYGFRVASLVPEPGTGLLVMAGLLGLAARPRRPAKAL